MVPPMSVFLRTEMAWKTEMPDIWHPLPPSVFPSGVLCNYYQIPHSSRCIDLQQQQNSVRVSEDMRALAAASQLYDDTDEVCRMAVHWYFGGC